MKVYYIRDEFGEDKKEIVRSIKNVVRQIYVPIGVEIMNPVKSENFPEREFLLQGDDGITMGWVLFDTFKSESVRLFYDRVKILRERYRQPFKLYLFVRDAAGLMATAMGDDWKEITAYQFMYLNSQDKPAIAIQKLSDLPHETPGENYSEKTGTAEAIRSAMPEAEMRSMRLNRHEIEALIDIGLAVKKIP